MIFISIKVSECIIFPNIRCTESTESKQTSHRANAYEKRVRKECDVEFSLSLSSIHISSVATPSTMCSEYLASLNFLWHFFKIQTQKQNLWQKYEKLYTFFCTGLKSDEIFEAVLKTVEIPLEHFKLFFCVKNYEFVF